MCLLGLLDRGWKLGEHLVKLPLLAAVDRVLGVLLFGGFLDIFVLQLVAILVQLAIVLRWLLEGTNPKP